MSSTIHQSLTWTLWTEGDYHCWRHSNERYNDNASQRECYHGGCMAPWPPSQAALHGNSVHASCSNQMPWEFNSSFMPCEGRHHKAYRKVLWTLLAFSPLAVMKFLNEESVILWLGMHASRYWAYKHSCSAEGISAKWISWDMILDLTNRAGSV